MTDLHGQAEAAQGRHATSSATPQIRLSCEMCRRRKIKCDKLDPCSNCERLRVTCVPVERARLPRGRSSRGAAEKRPNNDTRLKDRIARLEGLIRGIADHGDDETTVDGFPSSKASCSTRSRESSAQPQSPGNGSQIEAKDGSRSPACSWKGLFRRRHDMRDTCGQTSLNPNCDSRSMCYQRILLMSRGSGTQKETVERGEFVDRTTQQKLCQIYLQRVDPFFKILHRPSLSAFLIDGKPYLNYAPGSLAPKALKYAVCFAAICSLDEEEYKHIFKVKKTLMVERYQKEAESVLTQADYITTNDLTVLQAFTLFLLSSRSQDQSRRVWTMLSIALRIAQALSLHMAEPPFPVTPFQREMRRRLWTAIGFLDIQAATDRASEPMMQVAWLQSNPPSNVNDHDISFEMDTPVQESTGFTDMTFTMITLKAQCVSRILNFTSAASPIVEPIHSRQQLVLDFQHTASTLLQHAQPHTIPFHWFARQVAECINACMQLIVLRPLQQHPKSPPPRVHGDRLLKLAVDVLLRNQEIRNNPRALPWRWIEYTFVPWHALAVAISELCVCQDPALMAKSWAPIEQAYERLGRLVADTSQGRIWKPMENIMAQARMRRDQLLQSPSRHLFFQVSYPSQPAASQPRIQSSQGFMQPAPIDYATSAAAPSFEITGLGPWPSVWDAVDWTNPLGENEMSWLNYENFIGDLHGITDLSSVQ
ncbi:hypothetical protein P170DRAFT_422014 [Aspergillus steynii IBT 23096]|uniref:Zn(2)-C6 fungal-type domain-containing protein n=1 Tax=Aspergillus steynii IBT 23096 TaxID=1392250 RepID=A0A2I2GRH2_9EURO|nr:uncharacterized protein P170DRAFT_422014 [Aspergillus steynii IBT 23096]PLB55471.1 hypothetical protein P170DRAFT_422014 [Aspergillus steynii IBT 23096]